MSEIFNYSLELVSADELLTLAEYYTGHIVRIRKEIRELPKSEKNSERHAALRKELFRLYNRRYYLRICHRARNH